jgi:hypothetical protein
MRIPGPIKISREIALLGLTIFLGLAAVSSWAYMITLGVRVSNAMKVKIAEPSKTQPPETQPKGGDKSVTDRDRPGPAGADRSTTPAQPGMSHRSGASTPTLPANLASSVTVKTIRRPGRRGDSRGPAAANAPKPGGPPASTLPPELAKLVESKALFGAQPKGETPVQVQGILGDSVLVNGQWIKLGESGGNIAVKDISDNRVVLEVDGKKREVTVWPQMPGLPPQGGR